VYLSKLPTIIGVIHLPRLPNAFSNSTSSINLIAEDALSEAKLLEELGYDGVIIENFGDAPYQKKVSDPLTISALTVITREVVKATGIRVGVNLLRNSGFEAYCIAIATGASFIRINSLVETLISDSGLIEPEAPRLRDLRLNYPGVFVMADILVKHSGSLYYMALKSIAADRGLSVEDVLKDILLDTIERGRADAVIVTGSRTGEPPEIKELQIIRKHSPVPVYVGSGANPSNLKELLKNADGVIVGSYLKEGGKAGNKIDRKRAEEFIKTAKGLSN
jgi:membrane complex biogenesis BtpA family protein